MRFGRERNKAAYSILERRDEKDRTGKEMGFMATYVINDSIEELIELNVMPLIDVSQRLRKNCWN